MQSIYDLPTPALLVDLDRLESNIRGMAERAQELDVSLRPHIKTHKTVEIGRLQQEAGCAGITVSTFHEATVFADAGFPDITWALPIAPSRVGALRDLAERVKLGVVVDSRAGVDALAGAGFAFLTWIKVDCGYHRAGVPSEGNAARDLARAIGDAGLQFAGLLSHSGNAYDAKTADARAAIAEEERARITDVAARLRTSGTNVAAISVGSTPSMTAVRDLMGVDEARPGNYVYFDRTQLQLGTCALRDCAVSVLASVISRGAQHSICDAGALAMSKDPGPGDGSYGHVWADYDGDVLEPELHLAGLSQEHGWLSRSIPVGTRVRILPNHSCLTVACFDSVHAVRGGHVEATWRVRNGRDPVAP